MSPNATLRSWPATDNNGALPTDPHRHESGRLAFTCCAGGPPATTRRPVPSPILRSPFTAGLTAFASTPGDGRGRRQQRPVRVWVSSGTTACAAGVLTPAGINGPRFGSSSGRFNRRPRRQGLLCYPSFSKWNQGETRSLRDAVGVASRAWKLSRSSSRCFSWHPRTLCPVLVSDQT
jgi:hypothetical protein